MLPELPAAELVELERRMLLIRRFEEALIGLTATHPAGHFHVYIGQEPTGVPALALLGPGDQAYTTHRNHGHLLARGVDPGRLLAEILGRSTGYNRGRGGTLHCCSAEHGFPTTSASVGGCIPLAVGAAFAFQALGSDRVSVCLIGDGALEEGAWHESVNIAALRRLPVIFLIENNSLEALGQKANEYPSSTLAAVNLTDLAEPFGVPAIALDGTDAGAVHAAMASAVARARSDEGPSFIEARTVRWPGSRPLWPQLLTGATVLERAWDQSSLPAEHTEWHRSQDGLLRFTRELIAAGAATPASLLALDAQVSAEISRAVSFAVESPSPAPEEALEGVFA